MLGSISNTSAGPGGFIAPNVSESVPFSPSHVPPTTILGISQLHSSLLPEPPVLRLSSTEISPAKPFCGSHHIKNTVTRKVLPKLVPAFPSTPSSTPLPSAHQAPPVRGFLQFWQNSQAHALFGISVLLFPSVWNVLSSALATTVSSHVTSAPILIVMGLLYP